MRQVRGHCPAFVGRNRLPLRDRPVCSRSSEPGSRTRGAIATPPPSCGHSEMALSSPSIAARGRADNRWTQGRSATLCQGATGSPGSTGRSRRTRRGAFMVPLVSEEMERPPLNTGSHAAPARVLGAQGGHVASPSRSSTPIGQAVTALAAVHHAGAHVQQGWLLPKIIFRFQGRCCARCPGRERAATRAPAGGQLSGKSRSSIRAVCTHPRVIGMHADGDDRRLGSLTPTQIADQPDQPDRRNILRAVEVASWFAQGASTREGGSGGLARAHPVVIAKGVRLDARPVRSRADPLSTGGRCAAWASTSAPGQRRARAESLPHAPRVPHTAQIKRVSQAT